MNHETYWNIWIKTKRFCILPVRLFCVLLIHSFGIYFCPHITSDIKYSMNTYDCECILTLKKINEQNNKKIHTKENYITNLNSAVGTYLTIIIHMIDLCWFLSLHCDLKLSSINKKETITNYHNKFWNHWYLAFEIMVMNS